MQSEFLLFADLVLASRLLYLTRESALGWRGNLVLAAVQALALLLCFRLGVATLAALGGILLAGALSAGLESRVDLRAGFRLLTLAILLLVPLALAAQGWGLELRPWLPGGVALLSGASPDGAGAADWRSALLVVFGLLLLANEANLVVRAVFHHCRLEPRQEPSAVLAGRAGAAGGGQGQGGESGSDRGGQGGTAEIIDKDEYNAGRVIGFLERWLMFLLIVQTRDFNALAFIIAAKGLARMKQLEDRQFAEYMLIGTFLSALCAIVVALFVRAG